MKKSRIGVIIGTVVILLSIGLFMCGAKGIISANSVSVSEENQQFINGLGTGYNIGNALDVCDWNSMFQNKYGTSTETMWGGAPISEQYIKTIADNGFGTVRLPVTYMNHIDEKGNVDKEWLERVSEVVDMIIDNNMYCIIDIHHDTGSTAWIKATDDNYNVNSARAANLIKHIAGHFKDYDDHLILEGFNEMLDMENHWEDAPTASLEAFNKWNQLFVDTVRATGGNNSSRYLLVNTYAATFGNQNVSHFVLPNDTAEKRLIVGVHNYNKPDRLKSSFESIAKLSKRGYPVIVGEFGATASADFNRADYAKQVIELCNEKGFCPIWWDNGDDPEKKADSSFALFNRATNEVYFKDIVEALTSK